MVQPSPSSRNTADEALAAALRDPCSSDLYEAALRAYLGLLAASPSESDVQRWDAAFAEILSRRLAQCPPRSQSGVRTPPDEAAPVCDPARLPLGKIERGELLSETVIRERR